MLKVPPPTRVALGTLQVGGQRVDLYLSPEWARYFESLNNQVQATANLTAQSAALTAFLGDGLEMPDVLPGPPGRAGLQGEPGLPLFLLQDDRGEEPMLMPPSVDGVYVPLNTKDAAGGVPGLTQLKLNLKNVAGTITSWFTTAATVARTWTMPDKDGTVAVLSDFAAPPAIGATTPAAGAFTGVNATRNYTNQSDLQLVASGNIAGVNLRAAGKGRLSLITNYQAADTTSVMVGTADSNPTSEAMRFIHATGGVQLAAGFGCNGKSPQTAAASGGTLAGVIAALVANGILSS